MRRLCKVKPDNKGSAVITVLIAVVFISILGAILLFTSYNGYRIKAYQTVGENYFYDAEAAVDEVRAGLQGIMSDVIAEAYTNALFQYTGDVDIDDEFSAAFRDIFFSIDDIFDFPAGWTIDDYLIPSGYAGGLKFKLEFLKDFVKGANAELSLLSNDPADDTDGDGNADIADADIIIRWLSDPPVPGEYKIEAVILKGLRVTHESDDGYLSVVECDLTINLPSLGENSLFSFRQFSDFAFIATGKLTSQGATADINGNVFIGSVLLDQPSGTLTLNRGRFISGGTAHLDDPFSPNPNYLVNGEFDRTVNGDVIVAGDNNFIVEHGATVWANNIRIGNSIHRGSINLQGNTYTAGSLIFEGRYSTAMLGNPVPGNVSRFIGFGNSTVNPAESSSIIVNSRDNTLDLSNLNQLYLAGHSFISAYDGDRDLSTGSGFPGSSVDILTGQSFAVKSDQLAYLVPVEHITSQTTNPFVDIYVDTNDDGIRDSFLMADIVIDFDAPLWGTSNTLRDYNINNYGDVHIIHIPVMGSSYQYMFYVFMRFNDVTDASGNVTESAADLSARYFRDYFTHNPDAISNYTDIYLNHFTPASLAEIRSSGVVYTGNINTAADVNTLDILPPVPVGALSHANQYINFRRTLTQESVSHTFNPSYPENPFYYIVTGIPDLPPAGDYLFEGKTLACVRYVAPGSKLNLIELQTDEGINIDELRIIICFGDIVVSRDFTGLILCDGNIEINDNVYSGGTADLRDAVRAVEPGNPTMRIGDYLNIDMRRLDGDDAGSSSWDFTELVRFTNWKKN